MADIAFSKPALTAVLTVLPTPNSSLIRVKIMTFASTAIPIDRIIPAIPGSVSVMWSVFRKNSSRIVYNVSAIEARNPGTRKMIIIIRKMIPSPIAPAISDVRRASEPSLAPTTWEDSSLRVSGSAPILIVLARFDASSKSSIPSIWALPPLICSLTTGALTTAPS